MGPVTSINRPASAETGLIQPSIRLLGTQRKYSATPCRRINIATPCRGIYFDAPSYETDFATPCCGIDFDAPWDLPIPCRGIDCAHPCCGNDCAQPCRDFNICMHFLKYISAIFLMSVVYFRFCCVALKGHRTSRSETGYKKTWSGSQSIGDRQWENQSVSEDQRAKEKKHRSEKRVLSTSLCLQPWLCYCHLECVVCSSTNIAAEICCGTVWKF